MEPLKSIIEFVKKTEEENKALKAQLEELKKTANASANASTSALAAGRVRDHLRQLMDYMENLSNLSDQEIEAGFENFKSEFTNAHIVRLYYSLENKKSPKVMEKVLAIAKTNNWIMSEILDYQDSRGFLKQPGLTIENRISIILNSRLWGCEKFALIEKYCGVEDFKNMEILIHTPKYYLISPRHRNQSDFARCMAECMKKYNYWDRDNQMAAVLTDPYMILNIEKLTLKEIRIIKEEYAKYHMKMSFYGTVSMNTDNFAGEKEMYKFIYEFPVSFSYFKSITPKQKAMGIMLVAIATGHDKKVPENLEQWLSVTDLVNLLHEAVTFEPKFLESIKDITQ